MKVVPANTPGTRYSTTYSVDPRTGHLLLFGGFLYNKDAANVETQVYVNDLWDWDGAKWTKLSPPAGPAARENSGFTYDPLYDRMVLFGGYGARYFGDFWFYDTTTTSWQNLVDSPSSNRRRTGPAFQTPPAGSGLRLGNQ